MSIEQLADDIRAESRQAQQQRTINSRLQRAVDLIGLTRDEQIAHIVAHIRWQARKQNAPVDWYR